MTSIQQQHAEFERQKNIKAFSYTTVITVAVFFLFFISWTIPQPPPPPVDEGIEVNLGNSETGLGDVPPQIPDEMSNAEHTTVAAPQTTQAAAETQAEVADNKEPDAPEIHTSPKPEVKKNPAKTENTTAKNNNTKPVVNTPPKVVKPKAVYAGGKSSTGTGNNADSYNKAKDQGIAGGKGDQGQPNGNPNSDSYKGNGGTGTSGIRITNGLTGRSARNTRFEDTYKYGGIVYVNVTVDEEGNVTSATMKQGSPFPDINAIALKRAKQIKFSKGTEVQSGTIQIKFENPKG
ncbi:TonB family protein [Panacibacter ginsenosidivorans]|uniref:TonB family protein n=1 Tax=Panacibacter ginsenosidivorans TaxID=1813871 RepID=A0A5B8V5B7_9BACT|nr:energy transducer TonB [Panacibacter ginsenosidivorans]QEC66379.1 TonB family protein [Panacibacter ginsenosidivorans]